MANKHRAHDEEAWNNAKKICRLNSRQIEMAHALGMNPKKLPGLRPAPHQRWKLPVGAFIEELYSKRFGADLCGQFPRGAKLKSPDTSAMATVDPEALARVHDDPASQFSDLSCYFVNLAEDLQQWAAHGSIDPDVLPQLREELLEIVKALDTGDSVPQVPSIPVPPQPKRRGLSPRSRDERTFGDDDIPF